MKKIFGLMLLCATLVGFVSCEKSEEDLSNYPSIIGTWYDYYVSSSSNDYISITMESEISWTFRSNGTATERLDVYMNDVLLKSSSLNFEYNYKGSYIDFKKDDGISFRFNVSVNGNKMRLGNEEDGYFELTKK